MVIWKLSGLYNADPEKVASEIEMIESATPKNILEYARNKNTELHKCFEWNDAIAAEHYRLQQARSIVCNLVYEQKREQKHVQVRVFYQTDKADYKPTKLIIQNKTEYEKLLQQAKTELYHFKNKYQMLHELDEIFALIQ